MIALLIKKKSNSKHPIFRIESLVVAEAVAAVAVQKIQ